MDNNKTLSSFDLEGFANMHAMPKDANSEKQNEAIRQNVASHTQTIETDGDLYKEVKGIAEIIISRHIDITSSYQNWINLGFSLADGLGEEGREFFHELSQMNADYNVTECDKKFTSCLKGSSNGSGNGITINTFFKMAKDAGVNLSEIAKEGMRAYNPRWTESATSANPPTANDSKNIGKSTILGSFGNEMADGGLADVADSITGYTFSDKIDKEDWPSFLSPIFDAHQDAISRDKMLLASLNVVSGLMGGTNGQDNMEQRSGIYGIYDHKRVYAPLFNIVYGSAGSAKGDMAYCKMLARPVKNEMRRQYEAEKQEYEEELAAYEAQNKGKKKGEKGTPPKEPAYKDPFMPGNSSSSAIYRAIEANGGWGMMYETEADTVSSMIDSDYGNYSDLLRKVFHHETISMSRVSEKLHIDIENPRLSTFITCTPGQLVGLFPSFENGLGSRFLFYNLPDEEVDFHDVFASSDTTLEDIYKQMGDDLLPLYHALKARVGHPIQFLLSQAQREAFLKTYRDILLEQFKMLGRGITAFVFRIALSCFRYAMVLSALRKLSEWNKIDSIFSDDENALICDDRDFHIAMSIVGCLIFHTARVYATLAKEDDNPFAIKGLHLSREEICIYKALPNGSFRTKDFLCIAQENQVSGRTAERMLSDMSNKYCIITPIKKGVYRKHPINQQQI